jgi:hypothetical protein
MKKWGWRRRLAFSALICLVAAGGAYVDYTVKRAIARDVVREMVRPSALNDQRGAQHEADN